MSKKSILSEAINVGNGSVNGANMVSAMDPNNPGKEHTPKDWVSGFSGSYGYLDNLFQIAGKNLPAANTVAVGSSVSALGYDYVTKNSINTSDLLGLSSALLGVAATAVVAAGTAPVWVPIALGTAALGAGAAGTLYKKDIDLGVIGDNLSKDFKDFKDKYEKTLGDVSEKLNTTKEKLSDAIDNMIDKALDLGDKFGDWFIPLAKDLGDWLDLNRDGKYHVYDPLVLDLDGDGIETVGTQGYNGALFDHNSDGIRTATGWISSDDGLLVIDRNGNGASRRYG